MSSSRGHFTINKCVLDLECQCGWNLFKNNKLDYNNLVSGQYFAILKSIFFLVDSALGSIYFKTETTIYIWWICLFGFARTFHRHGINRSVCEEATFDRFVSSFTNDLQTPFCMQILSPAPDKCCRNISLLVLLIQSQRQVPSADYLF